MTIFSLISRNALRTAALAVLLAASTHSALAQQGFAPLNAIWHYANFCQTPPWFESCGTFTVEAVRDTVVDGLTATVLEQRNLGVLISEADLIIREEANRVYFHENGQFKLLYDFNLNAGDTMTFNIPHNAHYYDLGCGPGPDTSKLARVRIDSTAVIDFDGQPLKTLYTSTLYGQGDEYVDWDLMQVTERIGCSSGLFGYSAIQCTGGFPGHFRCYSDYLISHSAVDGPCDLYVGQEELAGNDAATVYPNPTRGAVRVESGRESITACRVTSMNGQVLLQRTGSFSSSFDIDLSHLPQGIYMVEAFSSSDVVVREKVIKVEGR